MSQIIEDLPMDDVPEHLSLNDAYRFLASTRRKLVLQVLERRAPPVDLDGLADAVAHLERDESSVDADAIHRVTVNLHHVHLPMMDELGILTYDASDNRVTAVHSRPAGSN